MFHPILRANGTDRRTPYRYIDPVAHCAEGLIRGCHSSDKSVFRFLCSALFFSCPRSVRTFSILSPFISILSWFWLTLPRGVLSTCWCCPSRPCVTLLACVHCSLHYLFLQATLLLFPHGVAIVCWFHCFDGVYSSLFTPALIRTHSFQLVFFAVHETCRILLSPFISRASTRVSSFFQRVQLRVQLPTSP